MRQHDNLWLDTLKIILPCILQVVNTQHYFMLISRTYTDSYADGHKHWEHLALKPSSLSTLESQEIHSLKASLFGGIATLWLSVLQNSHFLMSMSAICWCTKQQPQAWLLIIHSRVPMDRNLRRWGVAAWGSFRQVSQWPNMNLKAWEGTVRTKRDIHKKSCECR